MKNKPNKLESDWEEMTDTEEREVNDKWRKLSDVSFEKFWDSLKNNLYFSNIVRWRNSEKRTREDDVEKRRKAEVNFMTCIKSLLLNFSVDLIKYQLKACIKHFQKTQPTEEFESISEKFSERLCLPFVGDTKFETESIFWRQEVTSLHFEIQYAEYRQRKETNKKI